MGILWWPIFVYNNLSPDKRLPSFGFDTGQEVCSCEFGREIEVRGSGRVED